MSELNDKSPMSRRFRGFLPVVVDVETAGFNAKRDALLEIAAVTLAIDDQGHIQREETYACHVEPFPGANLDQESLEFTGIDPYHPFRFAKPEYEALEAIFKPVRQAVRESRCNRAILVGHNSAFDLGFLNAAVNRTGIKRNPFHPFSTFDTVTLAGLAYGQTVLARAVRAAGIEWDSDQAHSAVYDTERTADLFCNIINRWHEYSGGIVTPLSSETVYDEADTP
ncbi:MAG: ribonuclease T [Gammaproteobacteria bacterium]|nr:ribonuclease T [Gammaproteobacteria bacterium]MDH3561704.1 ribonuclease T [Gammaproteobacteria bacterium]